MKKREFEQIGISYIRKNKLLERGDSVLVGCSGGADSICLAIFLKRVCALFSCKISLAHINHNLREGSKNDEDFVRDFATENSLDLHVVSLKIGNHKGTLEEKARNIRHAALRKIAKKSGANKVALGHTSSDRAETVIHNLARGSGLFGVGTMKPVNGSIIRPILFSTRDEVLDYLFYNNQSFIEDESNLDLNFSRNRIRHNVIPELKQIFSGTEKSISRFASISATESEYLNKIAKQLYERCVKEECGKYIIDIEEIGKIDLVIRRRILRMTMMNGLVPPTLEVVDKVIAVLESNSKRNETFGSFSLKKDKKTLIISTLRD